MSARRGGSLVAWSPTTMPQTGHLIFYLKVSRWYLQFISLFVEQKFVKSNIWAKCVFYMKHRGTEKCICMETWVVSEKLKWINDCIVCGGKQRTRFPPLHMVSLLLGQPQLATENTFTCWLCITERKTLLVPFLYMFVQN